MCSHTFSSFSLALSLLSQFIRHPYFVCSPPSTNSHKFPKFQNSTNIIFWRMGIVGFYSRIRIKEKKSERLTPHGYQGNFKLSRILMKRYAVRQLFKARSASCMATTCIRSHRFELHYSMRPNPPFASTFKATARLYHMEASEEPCHQAHIFSGPTLELEQQHDNVQATHSN